MNEGCSPIKYEYGWPAKEHIWKGFARLINPGTQTREPGAPLRSCHNLASSFRIYLDSWLSLESNCRDSACGKIKPQGLGHDFSFSARQSWARGWPSLTAQS